MKRIAHSLALLPATLLATSLLSACGTAAEPSTSDVKIKGGAYHNPGDFQPRIQVALMVCNAGQPNGLLDLLNPAVCQRKCTGTIVAQTWILTAAHCQPNAVSDYVATYYGAGLDGRAWKVDAVSFPLNTSGTNYVDPSGFMHDLALLHLNAAIPFGSTQMAATLSSENPEFAGRTAYIGGTGQHESQNNPTYLLKWRQSESFSVDLIKQALTISSDIVDPGDSGGGFYTWIGNQPYIHAVASSHNTSWPFDRSNYTYTGFGHYPWIQATIATP